MTRRLSILLVRIDPGSLQASSDELQADDHRVRPVATFQEAMRQLDDWHPDVLVSDIRLGAHNGLHLAVTAPRCPVGTVFIDTKYDAWLAGYAERLGATYVSAPVPSGHLRDAVRALLDRNFVRFPAHDAGQ